MVVAVEDFDRLVSRNKIRHEDLARTRLPDRDRLRSRRVHPQTDLLQIQDHVRHVFEHPRNRGEFVQHVLDPDRGDRGPLQRGQEDTAQRIPKSETEAPLERRALELAIGLGKTFLHLDLARADQVSPVLDHQLYVHRRPPNLSKQQSPERSPLMSSTRRSAAPASEG